MTEDEAKKRWCPFARGDGSGENRFRYATASEVSAEGVHDEYIAETAASYPCIASACMAWRINGHVKLQRAERDDVVIVATGYCGLAGAPQ